MLNPKERFSNRVENYIKYRPGYPDELLQFLQTNIGINARHTVADIGSGTGIFSAFLLKTNCRVIAVEPNANMRLAAEKALTKVERFKSVAASAEETRLADHSVHYITTAQAFHWFNLNKAKQEFRRILKPGGMVIIVWNKRKINTSFLREYDEFLTTNSEDYARINHVNIDDETIAAFLGTDSLQKTSFANKQVFNKQSFLGRVFSSSYTPLESSPKYQVFKDGMLNIFNNFNVNGEVEFLYDTMLYFGCIH